MRRLLIIWIFTCAFCFVYAQDTVHAVLKFNSTTQWLSNIHEGDVIEYRFRFVNAGNGPLVISKVAQMSFAPNDQLKQPIAPGDSGYVLVKFVSSGKAGYFDNIATVKSNSAGGDVILHLKGQVIPKPDPNAPHISFDSTIAWFDTVYQGTIVDHEFHFTNTGKSPLIITNVCGSSGSVSPSFPKEPIPPGETGMIRVMFHTGGKMGPQHKTVTIMSNADEPTMILHIKGVVIPPEPPPPPAGAKISTDTAVFQFGNVRQGDTVTHSFRIKNTGTQPLVISQVTGTGSECICKSYPTAPIAPNGTGTIVVFFVPGGQTGAQDKCLTISSNSVNGDAYIHMTGTVVAGVNK